VICSSRVSVPIAVDSIPVDDIVGVLLLGNVVGVVAVLAICSTVSLLETHLALPVEAWFLATRIGRTTPTASIAAPVPGLSTAMSLVAIDRVAATTGCRVDGGLRSSGAAL
jgi:hypothetical protein